MRLRVVIHVYLVWPIQGLFLVMFDVFVCIANFMTTALGGKEQGLFVSLFWGPQLRTYYVGTSIAYLLCIMRSC